MSLDLLLVDDEESQRHMLAEYLAERGHTVREAGAADEALGALRDHESDLVLTDLRLPGADGVELIRRARTQGVAAPFLVITAFGTLDNAVAAMRAGAHDYLTKPICLDDLDEALRRATAERTTRNDSKKSKRTAIPAKVVSGEAAAVADPFEGLGEAMRRLRALIDRVAPAQANVLITGESGTGKEVVADLLHARSARADGPLIKINCAALPDQLLEAELFGHAKGAFTGAAQARRGHFESARGGTILLDEIGDVSPALQVRLLRVLQEREVTPLGTSRSVSIDVRVLAATHRDLDTLVEEGTFREDLLYRLRTVELHVPPLRERPEDIAVLGPRLLLRHAHRNRVARKPLSTGALAALTQYVWPGNVRELEHVLERALILAAGDEIVPTDLPSAISAVADDAPPRTLKEAVASLEKSWIRRAMRRADNVRARAARLLGIPERVLRYKLRKYGLDPNRRK